MRLLPVLVVAVVCAVCTRADTGRDHTGRDAWLEYPPLLRYAPDLPAVIVAAGNSPLIASAQVEIVRAVRSMTGRDLRIETGLPAERAIVIGAAADRTRAFPELATGVTGGPESFRIRSVTVGSMRHVVISGADDRGALYGAFEFLR